MANAILRQEVDELREYMKELSYQAMRTEMALARMAEGMQEYREHGARTDAAVARLTEGVQEYKEQGARTDAAVARLTEGMQEYKEQGARTDAAVARLTEGVQEYREQGARTDAAVARLSEGMQEYREQGARTDAAVARLSEGAQEYREQFARTAAEVARLSKEMREFKDEMRVDREQSARERRRMNKQWGELANRLGTLVEDIVAPNLPRIAAELFDCATPDLFALRVVRHFGGETREYDAIVVCPALVLINETKSRLLEIHVDRILDKLSEFPRVFPEYADRRPVGILASLYPDASVVRRATRKGVLVMGMGDENMIVLNPEAATDQR